MKNKKYLFLFAAFLIWSNTFSQNSVWTFYDTANTQSPIDRITCVAIDNMNNKWFGTAYGGLVKYDGTNWTSFNESNSAFPYTYTYEIVFDVNNNLWIATFDGLIFFDGTNFTEYVHPTNPGAIGCVEGVTIDKSGNIWFSSAFCGWYTLCKIHGEALTEYTPTNSGMPNSWIRDVEADANNNIWLASYDTGLIKFDGTNWTVFNPLNSAIPDSFANHIAITDNGEVWVGLHRGLAKFDGTSWTVYNNMEVNDITIAENGDVWVGYDGQGVHEFDGTTWTHYRTYNSQLPDNMIGGIAVAADHSIWIGTGYEGVAVISETVSGIHDVSSDFNCSVFPNSFSREATLRTDVTLENATLTIYNSCGERVEQMKGISGQTVALQRGNLMSGMYFLRLTQNNQVLATEKLMITD